MFTHYAETSNQLDPTPKPSDLKQGTHLTHTYKYKCRRRVGHTKHRDFAHLFYMPIASPTGVVFAMTHRRRVAQLHGLTRKNGVGIRRGKDFGLST